MIDRSELTDEPTDARIFCRRIAPLIGEAQTDVPDEYEATGRFVAPDGFKSVITFEREETTLGEILRVAQALEAAGQRVGIRFSRIADSPSGMVWGVVLAVRV